MDKQIDRFTIPALVFTPLLPMSLFILILTFGMAIPLVADKLGVPGFLLVVYLVPFLFTLAIAVLNYFLTHFTNGEIKWWLGALSGMVVGGALGLVTSTTEGDVIPWMILGILTGLLYWFFLLFTGKRPKNNR